MLYTGTNTGLDDHTILIRIRSNEVCNDIRELMVPIPFPEKWLPGKFKFYLVLVFPSRNRNHYKSRFFIILEGFMFKF